MFGQDLGVDPIKTCSCTRIHLHRFGQELDQLPIPVSHLASGVPKWSHDCLKISPCLVLEVADEGRAVELGRGGIDDVELRAKTIIQIVIVLDRIAEVKNGGLNGGDWKRHGGG